MVATTGLPPDDMGRVYAAVRDPGAPGSYHVQIRVTDAAGNTRAYSAAIRRSI